MSPELIDPKTDPIAYDIAIEMVFDPKYSDLTAKELRELIDEKVLEVKRDLLREIVTEFIEKDKDNE